MNLHDLTGKPLGQYELRNLLGEGGMGAVYRAWQTTLDREVAIKILPSNLAEQSDYTQRFVREAKTAAALEHANIVPIHDYGTQDLGALKLNYIVMRLLTGGSLAARLKFSRETGQPLPSLYEIITITRQLASALDYAHGKGVIHRDIKPNNIMFDQQGMGFLVDFGIVKLQNATSEITESGVVMGTPAYISPEQCLDGIITPASDQYSLGIVIYEMLTGRLPLEASSLYALMRMHIDEPPTPVRKYRGDLPVEVEAVLERALAKNPAARYPKVRYLAEALATALKGRDKVETTGFFITPLPQKTPRAADLTPAVSVSITPAPSPTPPVVTSPPTSFPPIAPPPATLSTSQPLVPTPPNARREGLISIVIGVAFVLLALIVMAWVSLNNTEQLNALQTSVAQAAITASTAPVTVTPSASFQPLGTIPSMTPTPPGTILLNLDQTATRLARQLGAIPSTTPALTPNDLTPIDFQWNITDIRHTATTLAQMFSRTNTPSPTLTPTRRTAVVTPTPRPTSIRTSTPTRTPTPSPTVLGASLTIEYDDSLAGAISDEAFEQIYTFEGSVGEVITITMIENADEHQLDPFLILLASDSTEITRNDDAVEDEVGPYNAQILNFALPADDIYTIVATRYLLERGNTDGEYTLMLESLGVVCMLISLNNDDVIIRREPSSAVAQQGLLAPDVIAFADGQILDAQNVRWWHLQEGGWVRADTVTENSNCANLPAVTITSTPTRTPRAPTRTPTAIPTRTRIPTATPTPLTYNVVSLPL